MTPAAPITLPAPDLAARLQEGWPGLFPTDTLPALAAAPGHAHRLWTLKQRPADKPLIFQETVVTKPRRVKTCDKKEKQKQMYI